MHVRVSATNSCFNAENSFQTLSSSSGHGIGQLQVFRELLPVSLSCSNHRRDGTQQNHVLYVMKVIRIRFRTRLHCVVVLGLVACLVSKAQRNTKQINLMKASRCVAYPVCPKALRVTVTCVSIILVLVLVFTCFRATANVRTDTGPARWTKQA